MKKETKLVPMLSVTKNSFGYWFVIKSLYTATLPRKMEEFISIGLGKYNNPKSALEEALVWAMVDEIPVFVDLKVYNILCGDSDDNSQLSHVEWTANNIIAKSPGYFNKEYNK